MSVRRVPFDESWLGTTARWLTDPDLAGLIMSPEFDAGRQRAWFDGLAERTDYAVWGIEYDGVRVGVMGIKDVGVEDGAEYFMYLGDREYWGRGVGTWALAEIADEVHARGLSWVYGRIGKHNERSQRVHRGLGFEPVRDDGDTDWLRYAARPRTP